MATLDEMERDCRADPGLADLLAALDRSAAAVAAAGLTPDDPTADPPAIRERVARAAYGDAFAAYGDAFMDELHREFEALRTDDLLVVPANEEAS